MAKSLKASLADQVLGAWALHLGADGDHLFAFDEAEEAGGFPLEPAADQFHFPAANVPLEALEAPDAIPPALGPAAGTISGDSLVFEPGILAAAAAQIVDLPPTAPAPEFTLNLAGEVEAAPAPDGSVSALLEASGFVSSNPGAPEQAASAPQSGPSGGWLIENDGSARFVEDIFAERARVQVPPGQQYSALDTPL